MYNTCMTSYDRALETFTKSVCDNVVTAISNTGIAHPFDTGEPPLEERFEMLVQSKMAMRSRVQIQAPLGSLSVPAS